MKHFLVVLLMLTTVALFGKVNINTASAKELKSLNGVGKGIAKKIITYRDKNGGFKSIREVMNVKGIGKGTFRKIKEDIMISGETKVVKKSRAKRTYSGKKSSKKVFTGKININTASAKELTALHGVGKGTAKKILNYRKSNGKFKRIKDIMKVKGIGKGTFKKIKDNIAI